MYFVIPCRLDLQLILWIISWLQITHKTHTGKCVWVSVCIYYTHTRLDSKAYTHEHMYTHEHKYTHLLKLNQDALFTSVPWKGNKLQCVWDWLNKTKASPVPGSSNLLYHLDSFTSFHWASGFFSPFLVLLLTHATVWEDTALCNPFA